MTLSLDKTNQELRLASFPREPLSRLTHDISDQNYSILMAADLLLKYWDDLSSFLTAELHENQITEEYQEIVETMPVVIRRMRKASLSIDDLIREFAQAGKPSSPRGGESFVASASDGCDCSGGER